MYNELTKESTCLKFLTFDDCNTIIYSEISQIGEGDYSEFVKAIMNPCEQNNKAFCEGKEYQKEFDIVKSESASQESSLTKSKKGNIGKNVGLFVSNQEEVFDGSGSENSNQGSIRSKWVGIWEPLNK